VNNLRPMSPLQRFTPKETQRTRGWVKTEPAPVGQILGSSALLVKAFDKVI